MKHSKCATKDCGRRFKASTSAEMERLEGEHLDESGHRSYIGILGWGNHTYSKDAKPVGSVKPQVIHQDVAPEPRKGLAKEVEILEGRVEYLSNQVWKLTRLIKRYEKVQGFLEEFYTKMNEELPESDDVEEAIEGDGLVLSCGNLVPESALQNPPTSVEVEAPRVCLTEKKPKRQKHDRKGILPGSVKLANSLTPDMMESVKSAIGSGLALSQFTSGSKWPELRDRLGVKMTQAQFCKAVSILDEAGSLTATRAGKATYVSLR